MIRVTVSNRVEELVDALAADLAAARGNDAVLLPPRVDIVVPSQNVAAYLRFELARRTGIVSNFHFHFLVKELRSLVEGDGPADTGALRFLGVDQTRHLLLGRLADPALLRRPGLRPLADYLAAGAEAGQDAVDRRMFQLASRLARLFEEYGYHRPEMLAAWRESRSVLRDDTELWQRELWRSLFAEGGWRARREAEDGTRWCTLAELPDLLAERDTRLQLPPRLYIFGLTYVSPGFVRIFEQLGRADLKLYSLSSCERAELAAAAAEDRTVADSHPALTHWARPSLVYLHALASLPGAQRVERYQTPGDRTLLERLQRDLLHGHAVPEGEVPAPLAPGDKSIQVLACPGLQRELEVVAADIWQRVAASDPDDPLRFNDVAVILGVSQLETYQAHVSTIFGEQYGIPHSIVDLPGHATSRVLELVRQLIELPLGRFTREEMLSVMMHPLVAGGEAQAGGQRDWLEWCDELGIFSGADRTDYEDTYVEGDLYSWDQGIRRLTLGVFSDDHTEPAAFGQDEYVALGLGAGEAASAGRFARLARSLLADARHAARARLPMAGWSTYFSALLDSYLDEVPSEEEPFVWRCRRSFAALAELDAVEERRVSYRIAAEQALATLESASSARGQYLMHGAVVSSFLPMRPLPFRAIYVLGLGEGRFPTGSSRDTLDLQTHVSRPRVTDVSDTERDRTMFLETLLSARDSLTLSYVARDSRTGEGLEPSAVVEELLAILESDHGASHGELVRRMPLRRHASERVALAISTPGEAPPDCSPQAYREGRAVALRADLDTHLGGSAASLLREHPTLLEAGLPKPVQKALQLSRLDALAAGRERALRQQGIRTNVTLAALRKFLECPLQGWASFTLRMGGDDDDDLLFKENEAFQSSRLDETILLRSAFMEAASDPALQPEVAYDRRVRILELEGRTPTGCFAEAERRRHLQTLADWLQQTRELGVPDPARLELLHYGRADEDSLSPHILPALRVQVPEEGGDLMGDGATVQITGRTEPTDREAGVSVTLVSSELKGKIQGRFLRGFVDYVARALELGDDEELDGHRVIICPRGGTARPDQCVLTLGALSARRAREWTVDLVHDLLRTPNEVLFPFEAALEWRCSDGKKPAREIVDRLLEHELKGTTTKYGPVRKPELYDPPSDPAALVERRYGLLFDLYQEGPWDLPRGRP